MSNDIQIFEHEEFGKCRFIEIDGQIYMIGTEVATALGYKNPKKAIENHVEKDNVTKRYPTRN